MKCEVIDPPAIPRHHRHVPYEYLLASSASSSNSSIWSNAYSQHWDDSISSAPNSNSDSYEAYCLNNPVPLLSSQSSLSSISSACDSLNKSTNPHTQPLLQIQ